MDNFLCLLGVSINLDLIHYLATLFSLSSLHQLEEERIKH